MYTEKNCIAAFVQLFPGIGPIWRELCEDNDYEIGLISQVTAASEFLISNIDKLSEDEISAFFKLVEDMIVSGNEIVQTAMTTGLLEHLINVAGEQIDPLKFVKYLGESSKAYCRAWDEFTGVQTEGLW